MNLNNLKKEEVVLCVDPDDMKGSFKLDKYFLYAIKEFVSGFRILDKNENIDIEIIDTKAYSNPVFLKEAIEALSIYKNNSKDVKDIVFIRRKIKPNAMRGIENEQQLIDELKKQYKENIIDVYLEELSFFDQVKIMKGCKILTGCHGGGFANMWWMNKGASVLELFPESFFHDCYVNIAKIKKINYYYINGKDIISPEITFEEYAKEAGLCQCCLRFSTRKDGVIFTDLEWQLKHRQVRNELKDKTFKIDKEQFIEKINSIY
jgi:hypothetical protein